MTRPHQRSAAKEIRLLHPIAREEILKYYSADSCIGSTAIAVELLRRLRVSARAIPVRAYIFNAAFQRNMEALGRPPTMEEVWQWGDLDGSWSIGLGAGDPQPGRYPGHLAALADNAWLWDLSIAQADRPEHDIILPPQGIVARVTRTFLAGGRMLLRQPDGLMVVYEQAPDAPDWRDTPNADPSSPVNQAIIVKILLRRALEWKLVRTDREESRT